MLIKADNICCRANKTVFSLQSICTKQFTGWWSWPFAFRQRLPCLQFGQPVNGQRAHIWVTQLISFMLWIWFLTVPKRAWKRIRSHRRPADKGTSKAVEKKMKMSNLTVKQQTQDLTFVDELLSHLDGGLAHAGNDFTGLDSFVDKLTRRDNLANKTYNAAGKMTVKYSIIVS